MKEIRVIGFDPSLRHWGIAKGVYNLMSNKLTLEHVGVIEPVIEKAKQVRQNSKDLSAAEQLTLAAVPYMKEAHATFVEVPFGSQSARAMAGYAICVGILGALRAGGLPFFEVTPNDVKNIAVGNNTATKAEIIAWARDKHPEANWPTYIRNGKTLISAAKAEHMADAVAAIYAGLATVPFQQALPFLKAS